MSLKELDFLSPKITLFYYGNKRHKSQVGAILAIIMVLLSTIYISYLILNIFNHKLSSFIFYKTYITDAGQYNFNDTTGIFHYFQIYDLQNKVYEQYNSKYIRIFMSRLYKSYQNNQASLFDNEHWLYDICREGEDNKNVNKEVFHEATYFSRGACLRYYYNNEIKKYFPIEDNINFKYPYLIHGSGRSGNLFLETIIERCDNSSVTNLVLGPCASEDEINDYQKKYMGIYMQLLLKQVITNNYEKPIFEYINGISGSLDSSIVPINNINLSPFNIDIKTGVILPRRKIINTYFFETNRKATWENNGNKNILAIFDYWLQNDSQIIKGGYSTLYDALPSIGGIIQLIYYIFYSFNFLYNKYIVIQDCNKSFFKMYNSEENISIKDKEKFIKCVNSIRDEVKCINKNNNNEIFKRHSLFGRTKNLKSVKQINNLDINADLNNSSKFKKKNMISTEINPNNNLNKFLSYNSSQIINMSNSKDLMISMPSNIIYNNTNNIKIVNKKKRKSLTREKLRTTQVSKKKEDLISCQAKESDKLINNIFNFSNQLKEFFAQKQKTFKIEPLNEKILNRFITFYNYLFSITGNFQKKRIFYILDKFRKKILGEDHVFRTNLFLYQLKKYFNIKESEKVDIYELYENL